MEPRLTAEQIRRALAGDSVASIRELAEVVHLGKSYLDIFQAPIAHTMETYVRPRYVGLPTAAAVERIERDLIHWTPGAMKITPDEARFILTLFPEAPEDRQAPLEWFLAFCTVMEINDQAEILREILDILDA